MPTDTQTLLPALPPFTRTKKARPRKSEALSTVLCFRASLRDEERYLAFCEAHGVSLASLIRRGLVLAMEREGGFAARAGKGPA